MQIARDYYLYDPANYKIQNLTGSGMPSSSFILNNIDSARFHYVGWSDQGVHSGPIEGRRVYAITNGTVVGYSSRGSGTLTIKHDVPADIFEFAIPKLEIQYTHITGVTLSLSARIRAGDYAFFDKDSHLHITVKEYRKKRNKETSCTEIPFYRDPLTFLNITRPSPPPAHLQHGCNRSGRWLHTERGCF